METAVQQGLFDNFDRVLEAARDLFQQKSRAYGVANIAQSGEEGVLLQGNATTELRRPEPAVCSYLRR